MDTVTCPQCGPVTPVANPRKAHDCPECGRKLVLTPRVTETSRAGEPNTHLERHLVAGAQVFPPYSSLVLARYHRAAAEYGDTWRTRPLTAFAAESAEEGLDVGGWLMLLAERLPELPAEVRGEVAELVALCVADGARVSARSRRIEALILHAGL